MREYNEFEKKNVELLVNKQIKFTCIQITETGFKKGILDATAPVRAYFKENGVHDYEKQAQGEKNKVLKTVYIFTSYGIHETKASLYRPNTKKGDPRIWFYGLNKYVCPNDIFAIIYARGCLYVIDLTKIDIPKILNSCLDSPLKDFITEISINEKSIADELLGLIREKMSDWTKTSVSADTGIGRTVESLLGIKMNSDKSPDYKGIELKSKRDTSKVRNTLFCNVPNWELSKFKNSKEICEKYGYDHLGDGVKRLHITLRSIMSRSYSSLNPQNLALYVNEKTNMLEANEYDPDKHGSDNYSKVNDVVVWELLTLHNRLLTKHHETFWIDADTEKRGPDEYFRVKEIVHSKNPNVSQFDVLLDQGLITVDFLLCRQGVGGDAFSFKIGSKARNLLFPESETIVFNA